MPLLRTVLFAADFSENSVDAFRIACSLAARDKALLIVLHVIDPDRDEDARPSPGLETLAAVREKRMREVYVTDRSIQLAYRTSHGPAAAEILRTADELGADLIALGTHGRTGLRRLIAGSVADSVLRQARGPVMALYTPEGRRLPDAIRVVLNPLAVWDDCDYILRAACTLASHLGARLIVLHVSPRGVLMNGSLTPEIEPRLYCDFLARVRKNAEGSDLKQPPDIRLTWGNVVDEILSEAREVGCDLIVMGTHRRSWMGRALMGSEARSVLHGADRPILFVKAPQEESPALPEPAADEWVTTSGDPPAAPTP
jgi:nucleotide-binding universal stress UspA family protein